MGAEAISPVLAVVSFILLSLGIASFVAVAGSYRLLIVTVSVSVSPSSALATMVTRVGMSIIAINAIASMRVNFFFIRKYLAMATIKQEVRFIGIDDTIEIWAKERVEQPFMAPEEFGRELENIMTTTNRAGNE